MISKARRVASLARQQKTTMSQNQEPPEIRDLTANRESRQVGARQEFTAWRAAHPDFTSRELLDVWARIRREWGLGQPSRKPR